MEVASAVESKRMDRDEAVASPSPSPKRQKVLESNGSEKNGGGEEEVSKVGATELASAFALASLAASQSPKSDKAAAPSTTVAETREPEASTAQTGSWDQVLSPKNGPVPISPEARSPARPVASSSKRVTFAPNIKNVSREGPRRFHFPPRLHPPQASRLPVGFGRPPTHFSPRSPQQQQFAPPMRRMMMMPPHAVAYPMGPPPMMPPPPPRAGTGCDWICDYCNVAAFPTFEQACLHEETCRVRCGMVRGRPNMAWQQAAYEPPHHAFSSPGPMHQSAQLLPQTPILSHPPPPPQDMMMSTNIVPSSSQEWFTGTLSLAIPESDSEWLSELNCFVRTACVEAFAATAQDVAQASKRGRIALGQVGIRCRFCAHKPSNECAVAAVSFPNSVAGIYESVKRWQKVHLGLCEDAPQQIQTKVVQMSSINVWIPTTRQYWADSARSLGMVDTESGIRFGVDPASLPDRRPSGAATESASVLDSGEYKEGTLLQDGDYLVYPSDMSVIPPYVYFLFRQTETCHFAESDRFVARSKGPVGYPGFQCRHCNGHAGLGKYFPIASKTLSTNSTSQNIHAHLLKCRKTPIHIKEQLLALKEEKSKQPRLEPGWRKTFFDRVWARLHG